ncbi:HAMP domain-containing sensor histidine kinase [Nocardia sp. CC227C]|uniref:sensor histidine kinase n=1 Tax=Nocardia sp. CC227C TaxID=3044562 RepID=UPI00278BEBA9|nr:HAMP domain-containing sensor histidine kinase [Nocardia sp. CC227C]
MTRLAGLRTRFLVAFVLVATLGAVSAAWASYAAARAALVSEAQDRMAEGMHRRVTDIAPGLTYPPDQQTVDRIRDVVGESALVVGGGHVARTGPDVNVVTAAVRAAVRDRDGLVVQRVAGPKLVIGTPIMITGVDGGRTRSGIEVYAVRDLAETQEEIDSAARAAALTSALALPLAAALALLAAQTVLRPVRELRSAARRLAAGDLSARVGARGSDELADLTRTVDDMAARLQDSMRRLRESESEARRFVADVSHELRTPLSALTAVVEVMAADAEQLSEDQRTSARLAVDATARLTALVADLIEVSRFDADTETLRPQALRVRSAMLDTLRARNWVDRVEVDAPESVDAVLDPRRLDVIVANLVGNALTHGAPPVRMTVRADADTVTIVVVDHGPGLPPDDPGRVFDRFYKVDASRSRTPGSGLGLAIAREHARLHGGDIVADNAPEGGARFTVRLPRRSEPMHDELPPQT